MKKSLKTIIGVTLLEILLVLVIASFVLVMSIRYYQTATTSSKVNTAVEVLTGIMAAVDSYVNAGNTIAMIATCNNLSCPTIGPYLPNGTAPNTPWGTGSISIQGSPGGSSYTVTFPNTPPDACSKFLALATQNTKVTGPPAGCPTGTTSLMLTVTP